MKKILRATLSIIGVSWTLSACSLDSLVKVGAPQVGSDIDHDYLNTKAGALGLLYSSIGKLQAGVSNASFEVGFMTDEMLSVPANSSDNIFFGMTSSDTRTETVDSYGLKGLLFPAYIYIQSARTTAANARYFLQHQSDSSLNYAISASYSLEGYAITILAENLCSGVPLSSAVYGQAAVYGNALSTDSLFKIAVAKFDSALAISHDSIRFSTLAKVGKGRALLSLARYSDAAEAVADVGINDVYTLSYTEAITPNPNSQGVNSDDSFWPLSTEMRPKYNGHEIANREGNNGLIWYVNPERIDPRVPVTVDYDGVKYTFPSIVRQTKFTNGSVQFKLASWIDAKMIEAEHLLSAGSPNWIDPINAARQTVGLADTVSPATTAQKVDLLFRERAFWFYGQGTRLSDMRRLVRQYGRNINSVFPVGQYNRSTTVYIYGDAVVFVPDNAEFRENYNYSGCIHRKP